MDRIRIDDGHAARGELSVRPEAARIARGMLEPVGEGVREDVLERAKLLVTEVVANSVVHGDTRDPIRVHVEARPRALRVQVSDTGPAFEPDARRPRERSESGWGLFLVDTLADRWGVRPSDDDVTVWFELDL
ncbi:MAG: ATP-binding protein [Actinomycetota bacterium]